MKIKKNNFFLTILFLGVLFGYGGFNLKNHFDQLKIKKLVNKKKTLEYLVLASLKLKKVWKEGFSDDLNEGQFSKCKIRLKSLKNVDSSYFRCNANFMECFLDQVKGRIKLKNKDGSIESVLAKKIKINGSEKFGKVVTRWNERGVFVPNYANAINLSLNDSDLTILLEDSCKEVFLPERVYSYVRDDSQGSLRWDNFDQNIFLDKFQVTFREVLEWKKSINIKFKMPDLVDPSESAYGLTKGEMRNYCSFKGKQLLQAHIWDAATYLPQDYENVRPKKIRRNPYPWTRKKRNAFLWKSRNFSDFVFEKKFCNLVFTSDCLGLAPFKKHSINSSSWIGLFQVLGGIPETMFNPIQNDKNLSLSSFYFPADSVWHQLGKRAHWDGSDFKEKNIFWKNEINFDKGFRKLKNKLSSNIKIGFRCMRKLK